MSLTSEQAESITLSLKTIAGCLVVFQEAAIAALDAGIEGASEEEIQRRVLETLTGSPT